MAGYGPDVADSANAAEPGLERAPPGVDPGMLLQPRQGKLEIHVKFNNNMWWAMPHELSDGLLQHLHRGNDPAFYVWDWQGERAGSYQENGEETNYNRYRVDFAAMCQRNIDNDRTRTIKIVEVLALGAATEQTANQ